MDTLVIVIANICTACGLVATAVLLWVIRHTHDGLFWFLAAQTFAMASALIFDLSLLDAWLTPATQEVLRRIPGRAAISVGACYFLWTVLRLPPTRTATGHDHVQR